MSSSLNLQCPHLMGTLGQNSDGGYMAKFMKDHGIETGDYPGQSTPAETFRLWSHSVNCIFLAVRKDVRLDFDWFDHQDCKHTLSSELSSWSKSCRATSVLCCGKITLRATRQDFQRTRSSSCGRSTTATLVCWTQRFRQAGRSSTLPLTGKMLANNQSTERSRVCARKLNVVCSGTLTMERR